MAEEAHALDDYKPPTRKQRRPAPPHPPPAAPATQVAHRKRRPREPKAPHPSAEHLTPSVPRPRNTSVTDPAPATPRSHCTPPSQSAASASRHGSESAAAAAFTLDQLVNHPFRCLRCGTMCEVTMSHTEANPDRMFYRCPGGECTSTFNGFCDDIVFEPPRYCHCGRMASIRRAGPDSTRPGFKFVRCEKDDQASGDSSFRIAAAKVLCVGAGGIGCELLKTLVCTGFKDIQVIDLDTIETSNLNRQFLFRKSHVGSSKAVTAAQVISTFKPDVRITPHYANVKDPRFDVDFFKGFDLVLNGLDNLDARRHVNRLCLAAGTPLVESGTSGYVGQVTVHVKGASECFECSAKPVAKSFPICTLRNTPDKPIHCVVWSKDLLFNRLFGKADAATDLDEVTEAAPSAGADDPPAEAREGAAAPESAPEPAGPSFFLRRGGESSIDFAARVFERVYGTDITRVCTMTELWKTRTPPTPLNLSELVPDLSIISRLGPASATSACKSLGFANPNQCKWSVAQNAAVFLKAIVIFLDSRPQDVGCAVFDKDDELAVEFVTAASNLRSHNYGIATQSLFDAKGMAGNIIHAIATTNAIVSGFIVVEALKTLAGLTSALRNTSLKNSDTIRGKDKRLIVPLAPEGPKPSCMVCSRAQLTLRVNVDTTTLGQLLATVVRKRLSVNTCNVMSGDFLYEEGEGLEDDEVASYAAMLSTPLSSLPGGGIRHGSQVTVQDQAQHFSVELLLVHQELFEDEEAAPEGFLLEGALSAAQTADGQAAAAATAAAALQAASGSKAGPSTASAPSVHEDEDDLIIIEDPGSSSAAAAAVGSRGEAAGKRKASAVDDDDDVIAVVEADAQSKRVKV
ncbi:MAG: hypothetical protein WDW38_009306 [Sanguina aurantia]